MNVGRAQLEAIVDALTVILAARTPADAELRRFFRNHKNLGQRDRAIVAETVYQALRRRRLLEHVTPRATPREIALATIVKLQGVGVSQLDAALKPEEKAWLAALKAGQVVPAAHRPGDLAVAALAVVRPPLALQAVARHDEARVPGTDVLVVEPPARHGAGEAGRSTSERIFRGRRTT